ncbi:MAG: DUF2975 domain-containing protein [Flavipsychrobacter sp.]|nr:DUF2975 domain-containing protein [Flavipsychrobacter sp.]
MTKRIDFIWKAIQTACWFIFAGYCVQTGAVLFNYVFSLFKPIATHNLHLGLDLTELYNKSKLVYTLILAIIIIISALKGYLFFIVIKTFKALNLVKPFSEKISAIITRITGYAFSIGVISVTSQQAIKRLSESGYNTGISERYYSDGGAYLMMSAILFVIALIFQKGIELQKENDLTI